MYGLLGVDRNTQNDAVDAAAEQWVFAHLWWLLCEYLYFGKAVATCHTLVAQVGYGCWQHEAFDAYATCESVVAEGGYAFGNNEIAFRRGHNADDFLAVLGVENSIVVNKIVATASWNVIYCFERTAECERSVGDCLESIGQNDFPKTVAAVENTLWKVVVGGG